MLKEIDQDKLRIVGKLKDTVEDIRSDKKLTISQRRVLYKKFKTRR